jgi:uncharacterized protein YciI
MRFVAIFRDPVDPAKVDPAVSAAHFNYLERNQDRIILAGGLRPDAGQPFCGALWIISAADRAEAERHVEADPYRQFDVWSRPEIFAWGKAPFYGPVEL